VGLWQSTPHLPIESDPGLGQQEPPRQRAEQGVQKSVAGFPGLGTWAVGPLFTVSRTCFIQHAFSHAATHIIFHSA